MFLDWDMEIIYFIKGGPGLRYSDKQYFKKGVVAFDIVISSILRRGSWPSPR